MPAPDGTAANQVSLRDDTSTAADLTRGDLPHPLAGTGTDLPEPVRDVIDVETPAADPRGPMAVVTAWLFRDGREPRRVDAVELPALTEDDANFVWIDLSNYTSEHLADIARLLNLHPTGVRIALAGWQRPRLDATRGQYFLSVTVPRVDRDQQRILAGQLDLFVGHNFLLSAHKLPLPFAAHILTRASHNPAIFELDSAFMLYVVLDELLAHYENIAEHMQAQVEQLEERALLDTSDQFLADLLHFKRYVLAAVHLADHHRHVFGALLRADFPYVSGDDIEGYFRDLDGRLTHLTAMLVAARDAVNSAFDIYVSHMAHRTNQIIKTLTIATVFLLPVTIVVAIFSTSITGMPLRWPGAFVLMCAIIIGVSTLTYAAMRAFRWF